MSEQPVSNLSSNLVTYLGADLKNQRVLVIGGSSRMGLEVARRCLGLYTSMDEACLIFSRKRPMPHFF